jgi:AP-3 complex subunit delta-1
MFEKTLTDLVKGIRSHKHNEDGYIRTSITEIKNELQTQDIKKKAIAIQKLTYLHMLGYDMEWAAFQVLEVISSPNFLYKRMGYLAASQSFNKDTEVLVLTPQTIRKDLRSSHQYETGLAIQCLSNICTPDLARDLVSEIVALLNHGKAYVRKKAILVLYKIFLQYPDALRPSFPRLKEKLADSHPSVVSASVNVICELARKNPNNYLGMAPVFFKLLTTLNNNWTVIKIVKLFGALTPHEPRLAKKLVEPMANLIQTTPAKSLLYECLCTVTKGMSKHMTVVKLAVEKLKLFIEDPDQNLKYLGLLGLNNLMDKYPRIIADIKDTIIACLNDEDVTIRFRALDLLCGVVNPKNLKSIIKRLMNTLNELNTKQGASVMEEQYKDHLIQKVILTCSKDNYANIANFKWYLEILINLTQIKSAVHGKLISAQLMDVLIRVKSIREHGVQEMIKLLNSPQIQTESLETSAVFDVLYAAAWLTGEFISEVTTHEELTIIQALTQPSVLTLPLKIQSVYAHTLIKVYAHAAKSADQDEDLKNSLPQIIELTKQGFETFVKSSDVEIQERSISCLKLVEIHQELIKDGVDITDELSALFSEQLNPVAPQAQKKLAKTIPEGLDLESWIGTPFEDLVDKRVFQQEADTHATYHNGDDLSGSEEEQTEHKVTGVASEFGGYNEAKSIFVLASKKKNDPSIPVANLAELGVKPKKKVKKTTKKKRRVVKEEDMKPVEIASGFEAPEGIDLTEDAPENPFADPVADRLSKIDLTKPVDPNEKLYEVEAYPIKSEAKLVKQTRKKRSSKAEEPKKKTSKKSGESETRRKSSTKKTKKSDESAEPTKKKRSTKKKSETGEEPKKKKKSSSTKEETLMQFEPVNSPATPSTAQKSSPTPSSKSPTTQTPVARKPAQGSLKRLCKDDNLKLSYSAKAQPSDANHLSLPVVFENTTDNLTISELSYHINGTMNTKLVRTSGGTGPVALSFTLSPGASNDTAMSFEFKSFLRAQELPGVVNYSLSSGEKRQIQFTLSLPSSLFIKSKKITTDELKDLAVNKAIPHLSTTVVPLKGKITDVNEAARIISKLIHVSVVERIEDTVYTMYGQSVQGHHVAVHVKVKSAREVGVELRCSDDSLGTSLITEIHRHFK